MLSDKFGELDSAFGWRMEKTPDGLFQIIVWTMPKMTTIPVPHEMKTKAHKNMHKAVDEAIELFQEHLSDCSLC